MEAISGYCTLEVKSFGEGKQGVIRGRLSHIAADREGDVILPKGLKFRLPIPLRHEHMRNVGHIYAAEVTDNYLDIEAQLADPDEAQSEQIRERLLAAWDSVRLGLARGLSVGIIPIKSEPTGQGYGRKYLEAELIEGSIVEIPANAKATISVVKSYAGRGRRSSVSRVDPYIVRRVTRNDGAVYL